MHDVECQLPVICMVVAHSVLKVSARHTCELRRQCSAIGYNDDTTLADLHRNPLGRSRGGLKVFLPRSYSLAIRVRTGVCRESQEGHSTRRITHALAAEPLNLSQPLFTVTPSRYRVIEEQAILARENDKSPLPARWIVELRFDCIAVSKSYAKLVGEAICSLCRRRVVRSQQE